MSCQLYRHFDAEGALLYVGISLSAISRLCQHRNHAHWFQEIAKMTIEHFPSRKDALEAERRAINEENPRHNLYRPKSREQKAAEKASELSRLDLMNRIVRFNPLYSPREVGEILGIGPTHVKRLIDERELGAIELPPHRAGQAPRQKVTGWQLIEYLEHKQESCEAA